MFSPPAIETLIVCMPSSFSTHTNTHLSVSICFFVIASNNNMSSGYSQVWVSSLNNKIRFSQSDKENKAEIWKNEQFQSEFTRKNPKDFPNKGNGPFSACVLHKMYDSQIDNGNEIWNIHIFRSIKYSFKILKYEVYISIWNHTFLCA